MPSQRRADARFDDERLFVWCAYAPTALVIAGVVLVPIIATFVMSLSAINTLVGGGSFVGLANYAALLGEPDFWVSLANGLIYTVGSTLLATVAGLLVALLLNRPFYGRGAVRALVIFPYIVPAIVVVFIWKFMFTTRGLINDVLTSLGMVESMVPWLGDQRFAMLTVIIISAWAWFPFAAITLLAALQTLPQQVLEAAALDGAGPLHRFWFITLPLLMPAILIVALIRAIWAFRNFDMIWLLTGGGPAGATEVLPIMAYREAFGTFRMGHATAVSCCLMLVMIGFVMVYFRLQRQRPPTAAA
ncbi:MAG: sugar ABC transporter permease [Pseudomonadota bacterium]